MLSYEFYHLKLGKHQISQVLKWATSKFRSHSHSQYFQNFAANPLYRAGWLISLRQPWL